MASVRQHRARLRTEDRRCPGVIHQGLGLNKNLEDKQFIAQTVNYANNDGVVWCVLTNGLAYRVYKTNEPVAMDQKLLFEVDLAEVADGGVAAAKPLQLLSRASLVNGELDLWGERVSHRYPCAQGTLPAGR